MEKLWVRCNYDDNLNRTSASNRRGGMDKYTTVDVCLGCPRLDKNQENNPNYERMLIKCRGSDNFKKLYHPKDLIILNPDIGITPTIEEKQKQRMLREETARAKMQEDNMKRLLEDDNGPITVEMVRNRLPDRRYY